MGQLTLLLESCGKEVHVSPLLVQISFFVATGIGSVRDRVRAVFCGYSQVCVIAHQHSFLVPEVDFDEKKKEKPIGLVALEVFGEKLVVDMNCLLFLVFRGGAHGGHYFAYIRDIDSFGSWTHPVRTA